MTERLSRPRTAFCYSHTHPPDQALASFERFQMPKARSVRVYERLANRLFIREQFPAARMVYWLRSLWHLWGP